MRVGNSSCIPSSFDGCNHPYSPCLHLAGQLSMFWLVVVWLPSVVTDRWLEQRCASANGYLLPDKHSRIRDKVKQAQTFSRPGGKQHCLHRNWGYNFLPKNKTPRSRTITASQMSWKKNHEKRNPNLQPFC